LSYFMKISVSEINPRKPDSKRNESPKHMKAQRKLTSPNHETRLINPMNAITTIPAVLRGSARKIVSSLALALLAGVAMLVPSASAQTVAYTANVNTTADYFNNDSLNMGHIFTVSGAGIEVIQLGYFDFQNHPLTYSHAVTLFSNETAIATVTIPAGSVAPLLDGFAFEPLSTPIYLPPGQYTVLAYGMCNNNNDPNGEGGNIGFNGSANLSVVNACYDWTDQGSPDYPGGPGDAPYNGYSLSWDNNTATASFTYTNIPAATGIWTGGGADNNWSTAGNWNGLPIFPTALTFAGSTGLVNTNDNTGITVDGIAFDSAAGAFVLDGNDITLAGNIGFSADGFSANPATPVTQTINLNMAWSTDVTIDTPTNGTLSLGGNITSSVDTSLIKLDAGTLNLVGTNAILSWDLNGGTTTLTGNTTINGDGGRIYVADGDAVADCNATLDIEPGAVLNITGSYGDTFVIGRDSGSGTVNQNGGTFTFNPGNSGTIWLGATGNSATRSVYNMNGGLLDMSGNTLGIGLGNGVLITGLVNQVSGVITNVYNLWVGWGNGQGVYNLTGGSIYIGANGVTTTSGNYVINLGGGTVGAEVSWSSSLNMTLTGSNGPVTFNPAGNTITLSGVLSGNGGLTVAGSGTLELSGANTYTGDTTVNAGTLQLDQTGSSLGAFRVANGAFLNLNFSGNYAVAHFYTNGVALPVGTYNAGNLPGFISGPGNLVVSSSISTGLWTGGGVDNNWSTAGNWNQNAEPIFPIGLTFAGSTRLVNTNDLSSITASSITFDAAAGAFVLNGNDITLAGNIGFNGNPAAPVTQTANLNMAWSASETIDTPANGNMILGGDVTSSVDTSLVKLDAGTLTLGGTNAILSWDLNGGTTTLTGNTTINGDGGRIYVADGDAVADCNATLDIQTGAVLNITGSYGDTFVIGRDSGSGTVNQNGGTFTFNDGTMWLVASGNSASRSVYNMNGGLLDMQGNTLGMGLGVNGGVLVTGLVNQVSGVITNVGNLFVGFSINGGTGHGIYNLTGGSIYIGANGITTSGGSYEVNLGGGTVGAETSWASSLNMTLTGVNGPVTFNPAGNTITLSGVLSGNGGLTVAGSGILDISGTASYTGNTTVNNGSTLELDQTGSSPGSFHLANGAVLNLTFGGTYVVGGCNTNGVALAAGVYTASNLPGFITGTGSLTVPAATPPVVNHPVVSGGNLILTGSGGTAGAGYTWLTTTNVATPIASWTTNTVGNFDGSGDFSNAIPIIRSTPAQFFQLRTP
jgi:autotransporter-associated beta strand protein